MLTYFIIDGLAVTIAHEILASNLKIDVNYHCPSVFLKGDNSGFWNFFLAK